MIVNTDTHGWEVIYQRAHGLLAMHIASCWRPEFRPERWMETLAAIAEHDDGQEDWEGHRHLTDVGAPMDFTLKPFSMIQLKRVMEIAQHKGRWVALLISRHMSFLYEPKRGDLPELDAFLDAQRENQQTWRKQLGISVKDTNAAYDLLQWCDQFSLILCKRQLPPGERALEISKGPDGRRYEVVQRTDETVTVHPWPFAESQFSVAVEATYVSQLHFADDQQLLSVLRQSPIREIQWQFRR